MTEKQKNIRMVNCPYCKQELKLAGVLGHVRWKHADKIDEFRAKHYDAMRGVVKSPEPEPKPKPEGKPEPEPGGGKPKSFLESLLGDPDE